MNIAKLIDHTVLKPDTKKEDVMKVLEEAKNTISLLFVLILHG